MKNGRYTSINAGKKDGGILDIAVCGKQPVREAFFKAAFSCVHMPGMMLRIRLYADDAGGFAEKMKKENPAFIRTVHIFQEDECIWERKTDGMPVRWSVRNR